MAILSLKNTIPAISSMGGVPGPVVGEYILVEGTGFILMEDGSKIKLE